MPRSASGRFDFRGDDIGVQGAAVRVDVAAIGAAWVRWTSPSPPIECGEELRGDGGGGSVGAVDDDALAVEREIGDGVEEEVDVLGAVGSLTSGRARSSDCGVGRRSFRGWRKISSSMASSVASGSLKPSGPKSLMPLSCQGLWEAEMTTPALKPCGAGEEGDGGGGDDAGVFDRGAAGGEAGGEGGGDPVAGLARVHAEQDAGRASRRWWARATADGVDGGGIERRLAGDGANAVGAEELLHRWDSGDLNGLAWASLAWGVSVAVTWAASEPAARRARICWPGWASAAERSRVSPASLSR